MAVLLYFGILDSKPFCHISKTAKAANCGMSVESTLYFDNKNYSMSALQLQVMVYIKKASSRVPRC